MPRLTHKSWRSAGALSMLAIFLFATVPGCGSSGPPQAPKVRVEGPAGTKFGYSVSYFDGKDSLDSSGTIKEIPESGVYSEDLAAGHEGVMVQVTANDAATLTVILRDGAKQIGRATTKGNQDTAEVRAGKVNPVGPFQRP